MNPSTRYAVALAALTLSFGVGASAQTTLSHSTDSMTLVPGSIACATTMTPQRTRENHYWRSYTLSSFMVSTPVYVTAVRFGVEQSLAGSLAMPPGELPAEIRLYEDPSPLAPSPVAGMNLRHTESISIRDGVNFFVTSQMGGTTVACSVVAPQPTPIVGPVTLDVDNQTAQILPPLFQASETCVVDLYSHDAMPTSTGIAGDPAVTFVGSNAAGQTGPSYLSAPTCGLTEPTDLAVVGTGFPDIHMVLDLIVDPAPPAAPNVAVTLEWSPAGAGTFNACTMTVASANPNPTTMAPTGMLGYEWDADADGAGAAGPEMVDVRVTLIDSSSGLMSSCTTTFEVDNGFVPPNCPTTCGDCNSDGSGPAIIDALTAAQIAAGVLTPTGVQTFCCDVNANGGIDVLDALTIAQSSAGLMVTLMCL